jgi:hypothetical protein
MIQKQEGCDYGEADEISKTVAMIQRSHIACKVKIVLPPSLRTVVGAGEE